MRPPREHRTRQLTAFQKENAQLLVDLRVKVRAMEMIVRAAIIRHDLEHWSELGLTKPTRDDEAAARTNMDSAVRLYRAIVEGHNRTVSSFDALPPASLS